jgi:transposase-like protein
LLFIQNFTNIDPITPNQFNKMEKATPQSRPPIQGLICMAFGHDYIVTRKITDHISEYKCTCCGKEVSNSFSGKFEALTYKRKEINECLASFFLKKKKLSIH